MLASSTRIKTIDPSSWTRTFLFYNQTNISISLFYPISNINSSLFSPFRSLLEYLKVWSILAQYSYKYVKKEIKVLKFKGTHIWLQMENKVLLTDPQVYVIMLIIIIYIAVMYGRTIILCVFQTKQQ